MPFVPSIIYLVQEHGIVMLLICLRTILIGKKLVLA